MEPPPTTTNQASKTRLSTYYHYATSDSSQSSIQYSTLPEEIANQEKTKTIVKQALLEPVPPPPRWKETYGLIEEQRKTFIAPVDTMGCDKAGDAPETSHLIERSERDRRLSCLVSLMLSSQTKDEVTAQATLNLRLHLKNLLRRLST
ncbi:hypothetical protein KEM48_013799 [Puccinia striiformis f. sp. tritici PST-130]|nr:hypothetical protein KEM48_013799 [Puccinia striiformis f. sp. tritici PST-130]